MNEINELFELLKYKNKTKENNILSKVNDVQNSYIDYEDFNKSLNSLLDIFVDESEIYYDLIDEYNENKNNYLFNIKEICINDNYDVFISISDKDNIYSNILRNTINNKKDADKYFNELKQLIKDNNVKELSSILISKLK